VRSEDVSDLNETIAHLGRGHADVGIDADGLDDDPIAQFGVWLRDALEANLILPNSMTLATATKKGAPSARIVLLKGIEDGCFAFYTNCASQKGRELAENPRAALVWHWAELERQVRAVGDVRPIARAEVQRYWASRPRGSRLGAWASRQSEVITARRDLDERLTALARRYVDDVPLPPFWGGYRLRPDEIEFWQGRRNRLHDRIRYRRAGDGWVTERVAP
jgi:pyridoxamine 5'-phosphate oxidase